VVCSWSRFAGGGQRPRAAADPEGRTAEFLVARNWNRLTHPVGPKPESIFTNASRTTIEAYPPKADGNRCCGEEGAVGATGPPVRSLLERCEAQVSRPDHEAPQEGDQICDGPSVIRSNCGNGFPRKQSCSTSRKTKRRGREPGSRNRMTKSPLRLRGAIAPELVGRTVLRRRPRPDG